MSTAPLVSIVIATYNRARVLAHAIESVRRSTITDWELLVVGDHCTDETGDVVASFGDARITYINLPHNVGEQSGPHNEGISRARGRYLAFLNHDDLFLPDHLASAVAWLERTQADLVWSPLLVALPARPEALAAGTRHFRLSGVVDGDDYNPRVFVFAFGLGHDARAGDEGGPLARRARHVVSSSQDWLFRAWRSGARLRLAERRRSGAAGWRARGQLCREGEPGARPLRGRDAGQPALSGRRARRRRDHGEREANRFRMGRSWGRTLVALAYRPAGALAIALGVHPYAPYFALRHGRRGNMIRAFRRHTGAGVR